MLISLEFVIISLKGVCMCSFHWSLCACAHFIEVFCAYAHFIEVCEHVLISLKFVCMCSFQ